MSEQTGLRERKKLEARRHVRTVALTLFVEHGYESVSVEQIAAAADVSRTTFFNYFSSKEAVIADPDPGALDYLRTMCEERPADEPLWDSLSAVMLASLVDGEAVIAAQKRLKVSSPALTSVPQSGSRSMIENLRGWAEKRVGPDHGAQALLQLNAMVAAVATAFEQWELDTPYADLLGLARTNLDLLGRAFEPRPADDTDT